MDAEALRSAALAVLRTNDLGEWTKPAPRLYPHQWSWDSAFIAIGLAQVDLDRALRELETLFAAQWSDGRVPHIVFNPHAADYFPGAEWWASASTSRHAPRAPATSELIQPPVHALALLHIYRRATRTHPPPAPAGGPPSPAAALQFTSAPSREPSRGPADAIDERAGPRSPRRGSPGFAASSYWRGPAWPVANWLFWYGLRQHGQREPAANLRAANLALLAQPTAQFAEYFEPFTAEPLGSLEQSWTAAVAVDWLSAEH